MAGLGPKPRLNMGAGGGAPVQAPNNLAFFEGSATGSMQPPVGGGFQQIPQPAPQAVQAPAAFPPPGGSMQAPMGSMGGAPMGSMGGSMQPGNFPPPKQPETLSYNEDGFENEPPILEELGINVDHVIMRMKGVALFKQVDQDILEDLDLSGPLAIIMALSTCLLFAGKITFSYVYGFGVSGCVLIWALINLMSQKGGINLYRTSSVLGYGLIPIVVLAFLGIFVSLQSSFGTLIAGTCIAWSTATASRFFATASSMAQQRWLVAYPVGLFYVCFSLLAVF